MTHQEDPGRRPDCRHRLGQRGPFDEDKARCMVMAYDYTVFAGTQGR